MTEAAHGGMEEAARRWDRRDWAGRPVAAGLYWVAGEGPAGEPVRGLLYVSPGREDLGRVSGSGVLGGSGWAAGGVGPAWRRPLPALLGERRFADETAERLPPLLDESIEAVPGDVDGDGDLDIFVAEGGDIAAQNRLFLNDGTGRFSDATAGRLPAVDDYSTAVVLGDLDGDQDLDIVVANTGDGERANRILINDGAGFFRDETATGWPGPNAELSQGVALGDVDGDGDLDIAVANLGLFADDPQDRLYLNDGTGRFTDVTASRMPVDADLGFDIEMADFDGDSDLDLVIANIGSDGRGRGRLYLNDGSGIFTDATSPAFPDSGIDALDVDPGDLDGDRDLDLVFATIPALDSVGVPIPGTAREVLLINIGVNTGRFLDRSDLLPALDLLTPEVALGDIDGDSDLDIIAGNSGFGEGEQNAAWINAGAAGFRDSTATWLPPLLDLTSDVDLADLDRDGDLDLYVSDLGPSLGEGAQSRLLVNQLLVGVRGPGGGPSPLPVASALLPPYPNPFRMATIVPIRVAGAPGGAVRAGVGAGGGSSSQGAVLPGRGVALTVHDLRGRLVRRLSEGALAPGEHLLAWDGRDERGQLLPSGVYLVRLRSGPVTQVRRVVLAR